MEWLASPEAWIALVTLTILEIVLGIDNIIFISILSGKLPEAQQPRARRIGLAVAMLVRILLLLSITWVMRLTDPLFDLLGREISGKDLILVGGGLFLLGKATLEIHHRLEGEDGSTEAQGDRRWGATFTGVIVQILLLDIVFSLDSVITAVGMADEVMVMVIAIVLAVGVMMLSAEAVSKFVEARPTVKMLALAFLILIGMSLVAEGLDQHIPKGYIYFAMAFSVVVELLNLKSAARSKKPLRLRRPYHPERGPGAGTEELPDGAA